MAYREYKCCTCGARFYGFENEIAQRPADCDHPDYRPLPPNPCVIHTTECFMSEPVLDSSDTAIELDRILTREARHLRETRQLDVVRRNL